jgi:hypothetical protein
MEEGATLTLGRKGTIGGRKAACRQGKGDNSLQFRIFIQGYGGVRTGKPGGEKFGDQGRGFKKVPWREGGHGNSWRSANLQSSRLAM